MAGPPAKKSPSKVLGLSECPSVQAESARIGGGECKDLPAMVELINAHALNNIVPILNLIVEHNSPPMWATLLTDLNIGDEDYNLLVKGSTADWLLGDTGEL